MNSRVTQMKYISENGSPSTSKDFTYDFTIYNQVNKFVGVDLYNQNSITKRNMNAHSKISAL